jgi:hypothetical protein
VATNEGARVLLDGADVSAGMDAARLVPLFERPAFLDAVRACRRGDERRLTLSAEGRMLEASLQASGGGLAMRLRPKSHDVCGARRPAKAENVAEIVSVTVSVPRYDADIADAISTACRTVSPRAEARRVSLVNRADEAVAAAVETARLKDILASFLAAAAEQSAREGRLEITSRAQRGAIVVRAAGSQAEGVTACDMVQDAVRHADAVGGSVIFRRDADEGFALELRLPVACPPCSSPQGEMCEEGECTR